MKFCNNILDAFEKQLKADIKECFAVTQLDSDLVRIAGRRAAEYTSEFGSEASLG